MPVRAAVPRPRSASAHALLTFSAVRCDHARACPQAVRGTWSYVVDVGRDPATGKRQQRTNGGFRTRAAADGAPRRTGHVDRGRVGCLPGTRLG
ncbi:MAG: Arm DNA-binding domain-containing protein [Actinobacteria bacterium]|nr:Arm DNA-binding domain-containing protein [Actinomycetota bacterium]